MLRYTLVVKELLCGATMETETPQNRSRAVEFLTACLSYSIGDTYQVGAQFWGNERCGSINLQISSMWRSSCLPSSLPITPLNTIIQRGGGGKKSISCNAARVQNCPNSSQAQPDTTAYSQSRLCLWTHFSLAHFDSLFGCVLWHLAQTLPPCLFCLLSRDDSAIVLVNHLHNTYEACSLSGCWNCVYIFYKLQGGRSAFTPHLLPHMHFILCPPCVVSPSVHHSLHRGRLECVCNRFQCIFMQQVRRQTARQSVYSVWEHAGSHGQTEKEMDGDVLLAERIIRSTDMKIKGGQGSTAPPPKCLRTKNISVLLTYDAFGNPDGRVLSPLSV